VPSGKSAGQRRAGKRGGVAPVAQVSGASQSGTLEELGVDPSVDSMKLTVTREGAVRVGVYARPRAKRSRVVGVREGSLVVQLAAPPVDGAANAELLGTLADALDVSRSNVVLVHGESSRSKVVEIRGLTQDEVRIRIGRALA
jgi:uncharacterized protein (TIGR00251 family)